MFELTPYERRNHRHPAFYNPWHELEEMEKNFFSDMSFGDFKTDIEDKGKEFVLEADLPGFKKGDININIEDGYLTISAERNSESEEKDKKGNYIRRERSYGSYSRSFDVSNIKADEIEAEYNDGVLRLVLPKKDETVPTSRRLEIK